MQFRAMATVCILEIGIVTMASIANANQETSEPNSQLCRCEMKIYAALCSNALLLCEETLWF